MSFLFRWLVSAIAVAAAVWLVPGIELVGGDSAWIGIVIFALILSLINISIKPILQILDFGIWQRVSRVHRDFDRHRHRQLDCRE